MKGAKGKGKANRIDDGRGAEVLEHLKASLARTDPLVADAPGVRDVVTLLRWHGEAERELGKRRAQPATPLTSALEAGLVHAFLVLSRPALLSGWQLVQGGLAAARRVVQRNRFFLAVSALVFAAAFLVGYFAVDADSRFGDLLLLESAGGTNLDRVRDPVGTLILVGLGPKTGAAFLGEIFRILLLYVLFVGGTLAGVPAALALSAQGARLGSVFTTTAPLKASFWDVFAGGAPDYLATLFACTAGFVVAYRLLATGSLPRLRSLGLGLRDGVGLFGCGLCLHATMLLPVGAVRAGAALFLVLLFLAPAGGES